MKHFILQHRRPVASAALLFLVLAVAVAYKLSLFPPGMRSTASRTPVSVTAVAPGTINKPLRVDRTGLVGNAAVTPVNADFSGILSEVYVTEGQAVKAGQPLCRLQASAQAAGDEAGEGAPVNQLAGNSQQVQEDYDNALKEVNRYQKLYEQGAIARKQLDGAMARLQAAREGLNKDQNTAPPASAAAVAVNGSVTLTAPVDGIVTGLAAAPGRTVQAGQQLLALGSGQEMEVVVHLEQNDLYMVHLGTPAVIEAVNQAVSGQVSTIYPEIAENKVASFLAHIKLASNPGGLLKPGMAVNVHLDSGQAQPVAAVPLAAVFQDEQGQNCVYIAANGTAVRQQVNMGETIGDFVEITSNLPPEALVITSNIAAIKNGDAVALAN